MAESSSATVAVGVLFPPSSCYYTIPPECVPERVNYVNFYVEYPTFGPVCVPNRQHREPSSCWWRGGNGIRVFFGGFVRGGAQLVIHQHNRPNFVRRSFTLIKLSSRPLIF